MDSYEQVTWFRKLFFRVSSNWSSCSSLYPNCLEHFCATWPRRQQAAGGASNNRWPNEQFRITTSELKIFPCHIISPVRVCKAFISSTMTQHARWWRCWLRKFWPNQASKREQAYAEMLLADKQFTLLILVGQLSWLFCQNSTIIFVSCTNDDDDMLRELSTQSLHEIPFTVEVKAIRRVTWTEENDTACCKDTVNHYACVSFLRSTI